MDEPKPTTQPSGSADGDVSQDARTFGMLAHLLGLFTSFLGPLIIWLVKKGEHPFIDDQAKEALNFQLTLLIAYAAALPISLVTCGYGALLYPALFVLQIILGVIGTVKSNGGECFRYPFAIRLIK